MILPLVGALLSPKGEDALSSGHDSKCCSHQAVLMNLFCGGNYDRKWDFFLSAHLVTNIPVCVVC